MTSFAEFESAFLGALQQERSELQGLQGESEAQLSAWVEHLFRDYLGYTHYREISREGSASIGSKGSKQLYPDLRVNVPDNGLIFIECKRAGRLDGPKGQEEMNDGVSQLKSYIRAHVDQASSRPRLVLGVVTDGNRWLLMGLNKTNDFHTIAEWTFLTDDPRIIAQRLWLLAKPALAQPTSALVEFLARRTLAEVLKENVKWLTRKVNEKLPDGTVSEDLLGKWLREAFCDPTTPPRLAVNDAPPSASPPATEPTSEPTTVAVAPVAPERYSVRKKFWEALLSRSKIRGTRHDGIAPGVYSWIGAGSGVRGCPFTYSIGQDDGRVEFYIDRGAGKAAENKQLFDKLHAHKDEIERAFGGLLSWQRLDDKQGCRIAYGTPGGYKDDETKWPAIQDAMIEAMGRLEQALTPHLEKV